MEKKPFSTARKNELKSLWVRLALIIAIILMVNFIAGYLYFRWDITTEKRYSLSDATIQLLKSNTKPIFVQVYLEGNLESGFLRLQNATKDLLKEMKHYSRAPFDFEFVNPVPKNATKELQYKVYQEMAAEGFHPTNLKIKEDNEYKESIIFPSMKVSIGENFLPVQILENQVGYGPEEALNHSIISLEYKVANSIKKMIDPSRKNIVFLHGNGQFLPSKVFDFTKNLTESRYNVKHLALLKGFISAENDTIYPWDTKNTDLVIIARPTSTFSEYEKFKLDQYIMNGGKTLWLIDPLDAHNNYLQTEGMTYMTKPFELNLDDMLFKYGARVNKNLVQDGMQFSPIPVIDNQSGEPMLFPWLYHPLLSPSPTHPIGKNLDPIMSQYASSIDTIQNSIKKHIILTSSKYGRTLPSPVRVHLGAIKEQPNLKYFSKQFVPVGVLLEGEFESLFKNRLQPETIEEMGKIGLKTQEISKPNKMIIISDGDIIANHVSSKGEQFPLGYDNYTQRTFANLDFLKNCVEYLLDSNGLLTARNKEIKLRLLDKQKIKEEQEKWQFLNLLLPLLLVVGFGIVYFYVRKRKWAMK